MSEFFERETLTAGEDLSTATTNRGRVVYAQADGTIKFATDGTVSGGQDIVGVLDETGLVASGKLASVIIAGKTKGRAGGVLTRGTHRYLAADANGRLVAAAAGDVVVAEWIGQMGDAAAANGDLIDILVVKHQDRATLAGALGAVDNVVLRSDGVGGATAQGSSVVITDAGAVSAVTDLAATGDVTAGTAYLGVGAKDASAILEADSTMQGLLIPRMTTVQRTTIGAPTDGLVVYDTTLDRQFVYANGAWVGLAAQSEFVHAGLVVNGEVADNIDVDVTAVDIDGNTIAAVQEFEAAMFDANGLESLVGAFTLAESGAGAEVTTTAQPRLFFTTAGTGLAQIRVHDVVGASGATVHIVFTPIGKPGASVRQAVTFD